MVSCLSIQPFTLIPHLIWLKNILNVQIKTIFFVCSKTDQLFQNQAETSIYCSLVFLHRKIINKYLKFYSSACRC